MIGPFVSVGVITEHLSWPWIFWVNIPAGILAMVLAAYGLKDITPRKGRPFDFLGFILFGGSLALLCFALSDLSETAHSLSRILMMISCCGFYVCSMFISCLNKSTHIL